MCEQCEQCDVSVMTSSADVAACVDIMCEQCVDISVMMAVYQLTQCTSPTASV
jgi:hypothetical protein